MCCANASSLIHVTSNLSCVPLACLLDSRSLYIDRDLYRLVRQLLSSLDLSFYLASCTSLEPLGFASSNSKSPQYLVLDSPLT